MFEMQFSFGCSTGNYLRGDVQFDLWHVCSRRLATFQLTYMDG